MKIVETSQRLLFAFISRYSARFIYVYTECTTVCVEVILVALQIAAGNIFVKIFIVAPYIEIKEIFVNI